MTTDWSPELIARIREAYPNQIAKELASVQPIDLPPGTLEGACKWLTESRLARGVHPITEEKLNVAEDD